MKLSKLVGASLVTLLIAVAQAAETGYSTAKLPAANNVDKAGEIGVGLQVGSFSGINAEYWLTESTALNGTIAGDDGNTAFSLAHLWLFKGAFSDMQHSRIASYFAPYIGIGALADFGNHSDEFDRYNESFALAAQLPLGIEFLPSAQRFSIFAEISPSIEVAPRGYGFVTADLGGKFYF